MLPILVQIGFFKLYTFGIFLVLAFFWGCYSVWKNIQLTSFKEEDVFDGIFTSLFGGAIISRLVHVVFHFSDFGLNFLKIALVNGYPGFSFWGFVIGFTVTMYFFCNSHKMKFEELIDYLVPPFFLAIAISKLGSFFAGVEIGTKTKFPLAIKYAAFDGLRHVTPLYEAILLFTAVFIAQRMIFSIRREVVSRGFLMLFFFWYVSAVYFAFDFIRGEKTVIYGYSLYGMIALIILLTLSLYFIYYFRAGIGNLLFGRFTKKNHVTPNRGVHPKAKSTTNK